jgi:hypothetical protein
MTYKADVTVRIETKKGAAKVRLCLGGENFPWRAHGNRVEIGPGKSGKGWNTHRFWVADAVLKGGRVTRLSPAEYQEALDKAEEKFKSQ